MRPDKWEEFGPYRIIGLRVWNYMQRDRVTIGQLARRCGVAPACVKRWLNGEDKPDDVSVSIMGKLFACGEQPFKESTHG